MSVIEYEQKFVRLSKNARECVSSEAIMCKRFKDGLNKDIRLLVGILEQKEFVVLVKRACKAEELSKEKRKVESEVRDARKRSMSKSFQSQSKKPREMYSHLNVSTGNSYRDRRKQHLGFKSQATSMASVGNVRSNRPECQHRGRRHPGECRMNDRACFKPSRNTENGTSSKCVTKDSVRSEAKAPARAYAIRAREDASSPDVITGTFSLYDTNVIALIDPGSTHSYVCVSLASSNSLPVESTEFVIKVSNPLGKYVLVDKVCKNFPLMIRGHYFLANLMLLPFDEFDVILGMDWLTLHDAVVNCRRKIIELKCKNGEVLRIDSDESGELPIVISSMSAQRYVRKGCEAYLAYVLNTKVSEMKIESVLVVCEYLEVFPEELPVLPPIREVEFAIDLVLVTSPI
ncbi:Gag-Pol polyprotein [Gossypium australe]|uniref:Gag-Pol polyprotein n=1 Tax=Gossypium australe TaxID=47621 RepID=A0A5B6VYE6_9ROSI|nr:Gag-Pol polyprotein [Gossypium australe]